MTSLYQLTEDVVVLQNILEGLGGDVSEDVGGPILEKWMSEYDWKMRDKVDRYGDLMANIKADVKAIEEEIDRLSNRVGIKKNQVDRLKSLAGFAMARLQTRKLEGLKYTISLQKNGGKDPIQVKVAPESLPAKFQRISYAADIEAIRLGLEQNDPEALKIAEIMPRGESIRVR